MNDENFNKRMALLDRLIGLKEHGLLFSEEINKIISDILVDLNIN